MQTLFAGPRSNFTSATTLVAPTAAGRSSMPGSAAAMPGDPCLPLAIPTDPCVALPGDPCAPLDAPTDPCAWQPTDPCLSPWQATPGDPCLSVTAPTEPCAWQPGDPCLPLSGDDCVVERFQLADLAWSSSTPAWLAAIQGES